MKVSRRARERLSVSVDTFAAGEIRVEEDRAEETSSERLYAAPYLLLEPPRD